MEETIQQIILIYRTMVEKTKESGKDPEDIQIDLDELEDKFYYKIKGLKIEDEYKVMLASELTMPWKIADIIRGLQRDDSKIAFLKNSSKYNFDKYDVSGIIVSFSDDKNKLGFLSQFSESLQCTIIMTIRDPEIISKLFVEKPQLKKEIISKILYDINQENWNFIKIAGLENIVIPHILARYRYQIPKRVIRILGNDIEKYLGKTLPENNSEMSEYEKLGIDLDAIDGDVVVSEDQLMLDEQEKDFLNSCYGDENNKKRISIRDFIGTISPNLKYGVNPKNIKTWKNLADSLNRMQWNIENHSELTMYFEGADDTREGIRLRGIHGKYFVTANGNHRLTFLKMRYLTEIKRANGDSERIKQIEEEYSIYVTEAVELPENREEMIAVNLIKKVDSAESVYTKITECIENGQKVGYRIIDDKNNETIIRNLDSLKAYLQRRLSSLRTNNELYNKFMSRCSSYQTDEKYSQIFQSLTEDENVR